MESRSLHAPLVLLRPVNHEGRLPEAPVAPAARERGPARPLHHLVVGRLQRLRHVVPRKPPAVRVGPLLADAVQDALLVHPVRLAQVQQPPLRLAHKDVAGVEGEDGESLVGEHHTLLLQLRQLRPGALPPRPAQPLRLQPLERLVHVVRLLPGLLQQLRLGQPQPARRKVDLLVHRHLGGRKDGVVVQQQLVLLLPVRLVPPLLPHPVPLGQRVRREHRVRPQHRAQVGVGGGGEGERLPGARPGAPGRLGREASRPQRRVKQPRPQLRGLHEPVQRGGGVDVDPPRAPGGGDASAQPRERLRVAPLGQPLGQGRLPLSAPGARLGRLGRTRLGLLLRGALDATNLRRAQPHEGEA